MLRSAVQARRFAGCVRLSVQTFGEFYSLAAFLPRFSPTSLSLFAVSAPPDAPPSGFPGVDVDVRNKPDSQAALLSRKE